MPKRDPSSDPPDRWASLRATFAPKLDEPREGELDKLCEAVDEAAGLLRTLTVKRGLALQLHFG